MGSHPHCLVLEHSCYPPEPLGHPPFLPQPLGPMICFPSLVLDLSLLLISYRRTHTQCVAFCAWPLSFS